MQMLSETANQVEVTDRRHHHAGRQWQEIVDQLGAVSCVVSTSNGSSQMICRNGSRAISMLKHDRLPRKWPWRIFDIHCWRRKSHHSNGSCKGPV
jgi:hypothetical protein